ncbi:hypothetical protein LOD99_5994 [Oopsacas minuta]|uniref:Uncharacterized protein n=1 Tax=Oopsacas minuta TaxID=111878 RepID=A0AAV7JND0_9METZ|nr:hypothetical protein LOD99_5994 [Oopsacas minuta]
MANYQQFVDNIGEGRIVPAYYKLLSDINYCIGVFERLETNRTYSEMWYDWYDGKRGQIDVEGFSGAMNTLMQEIYLGLTLYLDLSYKVKYMQTSQESKPQPVTHSEGSTPLWGTQQELMHQFEQLVTAIKHIVVPDKSQPWYQFFMTLVMTIVRYIVTHELSYRAKMYKIIKELYLNLNQGGVLEVLRDNHRTVKELILNVAPEADLSDVLREHKIVTELILNVAPGADLS